MNKPIKQLELIPGTDCPKAGSATAILAAAGLSPAETADDFDWNTPDESIVVPPRPGIAIYRNRYDDIVVRVQNTGGNYDEDHFAYIRPESLPAVIKALKECLP
jgi:hypothetical protein